MFNLIDIKFKKEEMKILKELRKAILKFIEELRNDDAVNYHGVNSSSGSYRGTEEAPLKVKACIPGHPIQCYMVESSDLTCHEPSIVSSTAHQWYS